MASPVVVSKDIYDVVLLFVTMPLKGLVLVCLYLPLVTWLPKAIS